jgi:2-oxoglutarate ferredoxin oxidoreductase subunit delta
MTIKFVRSGMARKKLKELNVNRNWCKGCGICVSFCPTKVLELDERDKVTVIRPEDCICCRMCELRCPDLAIEVLTEEGEKDE